MATIKTQVVNGVTRILTKTTGGVQRVSCSCCAAEEEGCCMYPADEFETLFQMADLPDELVYNRYDGGSLVSTYTATKNDTANGIYWWDLGGGDSRALRHEGDQWVLYTAEFPNEQPPSTSLGGQRCLLDDPAFNVTPVFEDNFSDTYEVTYVEGGLSATGTISRTGLCTWSGSVSLGEGIERSINLNYNSTDIRGTSNQYKWTLDNFFLLRTKDGFQNTPVGSYTADGLETWTLQEV